MGDAEPRAHPRPRGQASPFMPRLRKRGEKLLHSKYVVILVIILTVTDCALVIAELILDLSSVKKTQGATEAMTLSFVEKIIKKYPDEVAPLHSLTDVFEELNHADIVWNNTRNSRGHDLDPDLERNLHHHHHKNRDALHTSVTTPTSVPVVGGESVAEGWPLSSDTPLGVGNFSRALRTLWIQKRNYSSNSRFRRSNRNDSLRDSSAVLSRLLERTRLEIEKVLSKLSRRRKRSSEETGGLTAEYEATDSGEAGDTSRNSQELEDEVLNSDFFENNYGKNNGKTYLSSLTGLIVKILTMQSNETGPILGGPARYAEAPLTVESAGKGEGKGAKHVSDQDILHKYRLEFHHSEDMEIAHKLHYASVAVVSILLIEVTMKIICAGSHFLKRKIEVFDAVIVVASVIVDLIFIKGLNQFPVDDSIFVLAFLLPWRVIRVVNSLVMAVIDHEHVKLRLLYSRKKKLDKTVETLRNEVDELKGMMQDIRQFCIKEGIEASRIDSLLGKFAPRRRKDSKFYTLVKLVMSTASINNNNNDNDSVSSSSMENDLRDYANRDSVLNEATSNENTVTSLKQYLSVPFFSGGNRSNTLDIESRGSGRSGGSPSIYITSPASDDEAPVFSFDIADEDDVDMSNDQDDAGSQDDETSIQAGSDAATIAVTSAEVNTVSPNVAFYVGSQSSLCSVHSQEDIRTVVDTNDNYERNFPMCGVPCASGGEDLAAAALDDVISNSPTVNSNSWGPSRHYSRFLTVPCCTLSLSAVTNTTSTATSYPSSSNNTNNNSNSNNNNNNACAETHPLLGDPPPGQNMTRSVSDNCDVTATQYGARTCGGRYGSPVPMRRKPCLSEKRRSYARARSESIENQEFIPLMSQGANKGRVRHHSDLEGRPSTRKDDLKRSRSHSPSPMVLLGVPGQTKKYSDPPPSYQAASRSMNDVSSAGKGQSGNPHANNLGKDGRILRRSCLSLTSEGRKRRGKSPQRVSFKVS
ncbi:uncharacterized protein LOC101855857 [Aplysia californica]|uniref:Voltage-gated hydrogen channel 1 n=1 Tax=Aplysia californica TaxID=6500 RepID=A0ABM0JIA6_APLCA|nr:uncharacterized protein LOC101855857 [Aplysia californica]XP_005094275.1 uncharacterized protein LOC101855857 [Aplysia californica]